MAVGLGLQPFLFSDEYVNSGYMKYISVTRELAAVGLRVVRGRDWVGPNHDFGDQDIRDVKGNPVIGALGVGTITKLPEDNYSDWVTVTWDTGNVNIYPVQGRYGYGLYIYAPMNTPTSSNVIVTEQNAKVGLKVKRGRDWKWDNQDTRAGGTGIGEILELGPTFYCSIGWARVKWEGSGTCSNYRIGDNRNGEYDLYVYEEPRGSAGDRVKEAREALERSIARGDYETEKSLKPNTQNGNNTEPIKVRRPISTIKGPNRRVHSPIKSGRS